MAGNPLTKIPVGVLGATGIVGQQYVRLLQDHPWFDLQFLAASERSAGMAYRNALEGRNFLKKIPDLPVYHVNDLNAAKANCSFVFSALDTTSARIYEESYAKSGLPVLSNASVHRMSPDIPLLLPEVNSSHADFIPTQQKLRGWEKGFIVVKPNCSLQSFLTPLYAIHRNAPISKVVITTLQSISGAGWPGLSSFDILDNTIPWIDGEEEKSEREPLKILGTLDASQIVPCTDLVFSAHCNRVPVLEGHSACVSFQFANKAPPQETIWKWLCEFRSIPQHLNLPSAPAFPIHCKEELDRPQPRLDRDNEGGMAVTLGRLRPCPVLDYRFVSLSHNTIRGAAGGGILNAELLTAKGYLKCDKPQRAQAEIDGCCANVGEHEDERPRRHLGI